MTELPARELATLIGRSPVVPVLLDVREPWEVALAPLALEGATLVTIPMQQLPARLGELPPDRPVICFCHHGVRSRHVAAWLERAGFDDVHNLAGSIDAWSREVDPAVVRY